MTETERVLGKEAAEAIFALGRLVAQELAPHRQEAIGSFFRAHDVVLATWQDAEGKHVGIIQGDAELREGELDARAIVVAVGSRRDYERIRAATLRLAAVDAED